MTASALAATLISVMAILPVAPAQPDFSGTWVLDTSRSSGLPDGLEQTMTVKQTGDRIEVETVTKTPMGEQKGSDVFVLNGAPTEFRPTILGGGTGEGTRTSRWQEGSSAFDVAERVVVQGGAGEATITAARNWTLAADGNTLTVDMTITTPQGEQKSVRVYTRQAQ